jgi:stearoyl-CoA desaturase (Delta-9 desaturase)
VPVAAGCSQTLPEWTAEEFRRQVEQGRQLILMDSIAHDVGEFLAQHPGGAEVMLPKVGKDATIAFNGGVQRHSKAARNLAALLRVAVVRDAADLRRASRGRRTASPPPLS